MNTLAFIPGMQGHTEVILIIFIILLLFGAKKLPELSRSLGKSLGEFKKGQREGNTSDEIEIDQTDAASETGELEDKSKEPEKSE